MAGVQENEYLERRMTKLQTSRAEIVAKINAETLRLQRLDGVIAEVRAWMAEPESEEDRVQGTIRSTVTLSLANLADFTINDLVEQVRAKIANAKPESIQAELSKAVARGEAVNVSPGNYRGGRSIVSGTITAAITEIGQQPSATAPQAAPPVSPTPPTSPTEKQQ